MNRSPFQDRLVIAFAGFLIILILVGVVKEQQSNVQMTEVINKSAAIESRVENCEKMYCYIKQDLSSIKRQAFPVKHNVSIAQDKCPKNETEERKEMELPTIPTNVKLFTDYRAYNLWYTPHYRLQQAAYTDELGFRRFNDDYVVALGSYYSTSIGDRFEVTLDTGEVFTVIFGDGKWDTDCDSKHMYTPCIDYNGELAGNLLEFIIDEQVLDEEIYEYGSIELFDKFKGSVVKMIYLGRDASADWDTYKTY